MPDFREFVRKDVGSLNLPPHREIKVIEELADQIEDVYASILDEGFSEDAAWRELQDRIPPVRELLEQILATEPVLATAVRRQLRASAVTGNGAHVSGLGRFLESGFWLDLKTALRRLAVSRTFAVTAVVTLAVCLGANAAIFTIVDQVLLNPLPVPDPSRIMLVANQFPNAGLRVAGETSSARNYYQRRKIMSVFSEQAMFRGVDLFVGPEESVSRLHGMVVTPSLLRLLGVDAALGRTFTDDEGEIGNDDRVVLSHGLWRELFAGDPAAVGAGIRIAGRRAVGKRVFLPGIRNTAEVKPNTRWLTVVGVAPELRLLGLAGGESPGAFYTLHGEANLGDYPTRYGFVIRTVSDDSLFVMPQVRRALAAIDARLVPFDVQTMNQRTTQSLERERLAMWLSTSFGILALFLSAVGVYGVLSCLVAQRMREMGIRVALGSTRLQVFTLVVRDTIVLVAAGLILGLAGTLALRSILETAVYGIRADNPALIVAISAILVSVVVLASLFPAHRATRVDPIAVLCEE